MNTDLWGWPQWTMAVLTVIALLLAANEHGKPRSPHSFPVSLVSVFIQVFVLYAGGFWK